MCNGPSIILVLSKGQYGEGIIEEWHEFLGPEQVSEANEKAPKRYFSSETLLGISICYE